MVPLSGIPRPSQTTQSPNPSVIPNPNENTGLVKMMMVVRKARVQSGKIATRILMMPPPRHGKGGAASRNAKTAVLTANQSENDENPKLVTTTMMTMTRKTERRSGRSGPGQGRRNRKAENNLKTSPLPPRPNPNPMDPLGVNDPKVLPPSQN